MKYLGSGKRRSGCVIAVIHLRFLYLLCDNTAIISLIFTLARKVKGG